MVYVLLSTYNGEKYIAEQLDSILNQDYKEFRILIRDDGSKDNTINIIRDYANRYNTIEYFVGENVGAKNSFFELINKCDSNMDYYCFSDQDDIWIYNKISKAIFTLEQRDCNKPLIYCSSVTLVNEKLEFIKTIYNRPIHPTFGNALIENICFGCTIVINNALLNIIRMHNPVNVFMHDWWLYMIGAYYGEVIYDETSYILYRQHDNNTIGAPITILNKIRRRLVNLKEKKSIIYLQVNEFVKLYKPDYNKPLFYLVNYRDKLSYRLVLVFHNYIFRQSKLDNILFKLLFLFGII
jgi:glycosyltransferase involved in cell wall biosynthesis